MNAPLTVGTGYTAVAPGTVLALRTDQKLVLLNVDTLTGNRVLRQAGSPGSEDVITNSLLRVIVRLDTLSVSARARLEALGTYIPA